ncbi:AAA family ATPase [Pseudomonas gingeri]|uniref:AAA family ATPase n=1 Tax=Pseudomonas gingeri TaxID=117681 RepID=UPI0015A3D494|nr:AAA family ATPase [Pseudomonas gingeri]NWA06917.1 AAA family ATPase [Pseudomonas gingeri]
MKIRSFSAKQVYGYLDFQTDFNRDVNFLVGGNGSGKTTELKLINALAAPNFKDLLTIPFESIELVVEDKNRNIRISAYTRENNKILNCSLCVEELVLPNFSTDEFPLHKNDKLEEEIDIILRRQTDHQVAKLITSLPKPIFLGLDRRRDGEEAKGEDYYRHREIFYSGNIKKALSTRKHIKGSLGVSLMETELLVQNTYRRLRELEEKHQSNLRDSILLSSFQYSEVDNESFAPDINKWKLLERQREIRQALYKVVAKDSKVSSEVDNFFTRLTTLAEQLQENGDDVSVEWLLNKAQIDRMAKIVDIIDEHKSKVDQLFNPIRGFLKVVNEFYEDSNKSLGIDAVGQLVVVRPGGSECTIEALSSGERQVLVILAQVFFSGRNSTAVFLIDEPELSLHLRWQEKISEVLFTINPGVQFILATHSPEIVGHNKNKSVRCR